MHVRFTSGKMPNQAKFRLSSDKNLKAYKALKYLAKKALTPVAEKATVPARRVAGNETKSSPKKKDTPPPPKRIKVTPTKRFDVTVVALQDALLKEKEEKEALAKALAASEAELAKTKKELEEKEELAKALAASEAELAKTKKALETLRGVKQEKPVKQEKFHMATAGFVKVYIPRTCASTR